MVPDISGKSHVFLLSDVKKEFERFESAVLANSTQECKNYIPIRLVTIVEQFFRAMIATGKIHKHGPADKWISTSTLVDICEYHGKPQTPNDDYADAIRVFCKKSSRCNYNEETNSVSFDNEGVIVDLISRVLDKENPKVKKWIVAYTQSFQSVNAIAPYAKSLLSDTNVREKYSLLFDTRHNLVHTLNERSLTIHDYFDMVKRLFTSVEKQAK